MRVLIAVTHLLGAGHLTRSAAIARAFAAAGHETMLISGGVPAPMVRSDGLRLVHEGKQLDADASMSECNITKAGQLHMLPRVVGGVIEPSLVVLAKKFDGDREHCIRAGMDDYISKPVAAADRIGMINK